VSENVRKLVGVAVMAVLVVVGVVVSSGDDTDYTRNTAFEVPKFGGDLNDQGQQPGDAELELTQAMKAAAKCEEGHVLISTGDPVSPWRCGPLLIELATVAEEARRTDHWEGEAFPCSSEYFETARLEGQSAFTIIEPLTEGQQLSIFALAQLKSCINNWASGKSVEDVNEVLDRWWDLITLRVCPGWPRFDALSVDGVVYRTTLEYTCPGGIRWRDPDPLPE
jgi:hypothetical protein